MKKKAIVAISLAVILIGVLLLLSFTVFSLKSVEVDFRTSHSKIIATEEDIIESGEFSKGQPVYFQNKNKYEKRIEKLDPYIKVINIETVFPSKFIVHIAERQEVYAIEHQEGFYLCDEELRIVRTVESFESDSSNAILVLPEISLSNEDVQIGDFINYFNMPSLYEALFENNRTLGEQTELVKSVAISSQENTTTQKQERVLTVSLYSGQTVRIVNADYGLVAKVKLMLDVHSQLFNFIGKTLKTPEGEVVLTEAHLKTCTIEINNYLHPSYGKNDCYFDIFI